MNDAEPIEERRRTDPWRESMEKQVTENTAVTIATRDKVDEVYDLLVSVKGALKVLGWLGVAAKWVGIVAGMCSAVYVLWLQATKR